jgi:uncharacterized protein
MKNAIRGRIGDWMQTFTGIQFWPLDPRPEEVCIEDIAHALSNICRFGGHSRCFYSVAEHSVLVYDNVAPENKLAALLHDAAEAYLGDMIRPLKRCMPEYQTAEARLLAVIFEKFGLPEELPEEVILVDNLILLNEKQEIMGEEPAPWGIARETALKPLDNVMIMGWTPLYAEKLFLMMYEELNET